LCLSHRGYENQKEKGVKFQNQQQASKWVKKNKEKKNVNFWGSKFVQSVLNTHTVIV
jgi:hypothetical protein